MSFDSALQALVQAHEAEINELRHQVSELHKSGNNRCIVHRNDGEFLVTSDCHHYPIPSNHKPSTPKNWPPSPPLAPRGVCTNACSQKPSTSQPSMSNEMPPCPPEMQPHAFTPDDENTMMAPQRDAAEAKADATTEHAPVLAEHEVLDELFVDNWATLAQGLLNKSFLCYVRAGWRQDYMSAKVTGIPTGNPAKRPSDATKLLLMQTATMKQRSIARTSHWRRQKASVWSETFSSCPFKCRTLVAHPGSPRCCIWACLSMVIVVYEVMATTMAPFDTFGNKETVALERVSAVFWIMDIMMNFFTGVYVHGKLELRLRVIARVYARTWFSFDFAVAFVQVLAAFGDARNASTSGVLFKLLRIVRSFRLGRMTSWMQEAASKNLSKRVSIIGTKLIQCLVALYVFVHLNACLWYEIGKSERGWVSGYDKLGDSAGEKYLVAMHWSLSQLQGNTDIHPGRSIGDRLYIALSSFASIIFLALLVSIMTDALLTAQEERKVLIKERRKLALFFHRHRVKPALRQRAEYYLKLRHMAHSSIGHEDQDRDALEIFPLQLRLRLLTESRAPTLNWHPVFRYLQHFHWALFVNVCTDALVWQACEPGDDIFSSGESSRGAYYISSGECIFNTRLDLFAIVKPWLEDVIADQSPKHALHGSSSFSVSRVATDRTAGECSTYEDSVSPKKASVSRLRGGSFVSEVSLWAVWVHVGDLAAFEHSQCFGLAWSDFLTFVSQHSEPFGTCSSYASRFVHALLLSLEREAESSETVAELMGFADVIRIEDGLANRAMEE